MDYPLLLSPIKIGNLELKNRVIFSAHLTNLAKNHLPSQELAAYYRERAKGGAGLIITEETSVHPTDWAYEKLIDAFKPEVVPGYRQITDGVHRAGGKILLQLNHNGSQGDSGYSKKPLWSAGNSKDPLFLEVSKAITKADIAELIEYYGRSAALGMAGGFDGIEFQGSHSSILRQFLSPLSNQRTDEYGGSLENRFRLIKEVAQEVKNQIGKRPLGLRLTGEEFTPGGLTLEDTVEIAKMAEATGLFAYINLSVGIATKNLFLVEGPMALPPAYASYMAAAVKKAVKIPVVGVGRIKDPKQAEKLLQEGQCDLVGIVRGQISDPYLVAKTAAGRENLINCCLSCNQDCIGRVGLNKTIGCVQNPYIGKESFLNPYNLPTAAKPGRVVVVGGGPAGLEGAITAANCGHQVVLFEASNKLGGNIPLAASLPYRAELGDCIRNLTTRLEQTKVEVRLNTKATLPLIMAENPSAVLIATGATPVPHYLQGDNPKVQNLHTWLLDPKVKGERVAIVDYIGFFQASATLELLADMGKKTIMLTGALQAGQGLGRTTDLELWTKRVLNKGAELICNVSVMQIEDDLLTAMNNYTGEQIKVQADLVLIAAPPKPEDGLFQELYSLPSRPQLFIVGDAVAPRRVENAIHEGFAAGLAIGNQQK